MGFTSFQGRIITRRAPARAECCRHPKIDCALVTVRCFWAGAEVTRKRPRVMLNFYRTNLTIHLVKSKILQPTVALHSTPFLEGALEQSYACRPLQ